RAIAPRPSSGAAVPPTIVHTTGSSGMTRRCSGFARSNAASRGGSEIRSAVCVCSLRGTRLNLMASSGRLPGRLWWMSYLLRRRDLIAGLAGKALAQPADLFEEIPPAKSGIRWQHDNALSPQRYLPETLGPGVAFVD